MKKFLFLFFQSDHFIGVLFISFLNRSHHEVRLIYIFYPFTTQRYRCSFPGVCFDSTPELSDVDELMMERNIDDDKRTENKNKIKSKKSKTKKAHKHKKKDEKTPKYVYSL